MQRLFANGLGIENPRRDQHGAGERIAQLMMQSWGLVRWLYATAVMDGEA